MGAADGPLRTNGTALVVAGPAREHGGAGTLRLETVTGACAHCYRPPDDPAPADALADSSTLQGSGITPRLPHPKSSVRDAQGDDSDPGASIVINASNERPQR